MPIQSQQLFNIGLDDSYLVVKIFFLLCFILFSISLDNSWWLCLAGWKEESCTTGLIPGCIHRGNHSVTQSLEIAPEHFIRLHILCDILCTIYSTINCVMHLSVIIYYVQLYNMTWFTAATIY